MMTEIENGDKPHNAGELQNVLSTDQFNRKNYLYWSQLIKTILKGKGKASHLTEVDLSWVKSYTFN